MTVKMSEFTDGVSTVFAGVLQILQSLDPAIAEKVVDMIEQEKAEGETPKAEEKVEAPKVEDERKEEPKAAEPEKKYTFEEVRKAMSAKSGAGFTAQVRALLEKYGATRLSEIKEEDYAALMADVEEIS